MLEIADRFLAFAMVAVQPVEHCADLRAAPPQQREQQLALLRVMQALGELVDVEQHGAQHTEVQRRAAAAMLGHQHHHRAQHGRQRLVLFADDFQGDAVHDLLLMLHA